MICIRIPADDFEQQWEHMLTLLRPAIDRSGGRWAPEDVFNELQAGRMQGWALIEGPLLYGVAVTEIQEYPGLRSLMWHWLGGVDARKWLDLLVDTVAEWAKGENCTRMEIVGRRGWEKMAAHLGFRPVFVCFEKVLVSNEQGQRQADADRQDDFLDGTAALVNGPVEAGSQHSREPAESVS